MIGKDKAVTNDCIRVLYEIEERRPELIKGYASVFITLFRSKNNRFVWGTMTVLSCIAPLAADEIYSFFVTLDRRKKIYDRRFNLSGI